MSDHKILLAVAFLQSHPDSAAEILEQQPVGEVSAFLAKVPKDHAAKVLAKMLPKCAALICTELPFESSLGMLAHLSVPDEVAILRCLSPKKRDRFIAELPVSKQVSCKLMLGYAEDMVGAHSTTAVATVPYESSAAEALQIVKVTKESAPSDFIFVVDREGAVKGRLQLIELLRCADELPVSSLAENGFNTIQGRMNVREVATHPDWMKDEIIPVVNRRQEFIGVLRHADLRKALKALDERVVPFENPELITGIAQGYGQSLLALFQSMKEFAGSDLQTWKGREND
ncbi:MAG: magnesium transporter MgtE N-terminal domain-containing protein [Opitutaceae bacterium]